MDYSLGIFDKNIKFGFVEYFQVLFCVFALVSYASAGLLGAIAASGGGDVGYSSGGDDGGYLSGGDYSYSAPEPIAAPEQIVKVVHEQASAPQQYQAPAPQQHVKVIQVVQEQQQQQYSGI